MPVSTAAFLSHLWNAVELPVSADVEGEEEELRSIVGSLY